MKRVVLLLPCLVGAAQAQEYSRFLTCEGQFTGAGEARPAHLDLGLRFNSRTALVMRSNVLPVGEKLSYVPTPTTYTMTYRLAPQGTTLVNVPGWLQSTVLVFLADLKRLNQIRLSVDRQTGALEGEILNEKERSLGEFKMQCRSRSAEEVGAPKF